MASGCAGQAIASRTVADLLASIPGVEFYIEDYLLSRVHLNYLRRRTRLLDARPRWNWRSAEQALVRFIRRGSVSHIPKYRDLHHVRSFAEIPFTMKSDLRHRGEDWFSARFRPPELWFKNTTGTTGPPISVFYEARFYFDITLRTLPKIALRGGVAGARADDAPVFCIALNDKKNTPGMVVADPCADAGLSVQVHVDEREAQTFARAAELIEELRPVCITSKPPVLEQLCGFTGRQGLGPAWRPAFVTSSGSTLSPAVRSLIGQTFRAPVLDAYTMTEFGLIASECSAGFMHVDSTSVYVEVAGESGQRSPEGQTGEIVISGVRNRAMPLLRYRSGDFGAVLYAPCDCGAGGPRLVHLRGKRIACFRLKDGSLFSPTFFNDLFARFLSIAEFQITQKSATEFLVVLEFRPDCDPESRHRDFDSVRAYVERSLPAPVSVRVESGTLVRDGMFQRYRSELVGEHS